MSPLLILFEAIYESYASTVEILTYISWERELGSQYNVNIESWIQITLRITLFFRILINQIFY